MSNMYSFAKTWNPLGGECPHKCSYCSTNKIKKRNLPYFNKKYSGKLRLDENAMGKNLGKGNFWFVCAQMDLFAEEVPANMICVILHRCKEFPNNTYFFQSKNPERFKEFENNFPKDSILCTTIETNRIYENIIGNAPYPGKRSMAMSYISTKFTTQVTVEPIMEFGNPAMLSFIYNCNPSQVNIGANSFKDIVLPEPPKEKILELISELEKFTTVHQKDNLKRLLI